jgi:hypothetical protein
MKRTVLLLLSIFLLEACTKDRIFPDEPNNPNDTTSVIIAEGFLKINEFLASGDGFLNEFGQPADWIEIFNPNNFAVTLEAGKWFITDAAVTNKEKYNLPVRTIPAKGFLLVWADNQHNMPNAQDIHASFALSAAGEHLGIFYKNENEIIEIDEKLYTQQTANESEGRSPDGSTNWTTFNNPTPGASNP